MKSITESLVPVAPSSLTSAAPAQAKSNLLNQGSFAEALARIKDKATSTGTEQRPTAGINQLAPRGSVPFTLSNVPVHLPLLGLSSKAL